MKPKHRPECRTPEATSQRTHASSWPRRHCLHLSLGAALVAMPALRLTASAQGNDDLRPTPAQTEGPFYPVQLPADSDFDLLRNGALQTRLGAPAWVEGSVRDRRGRPLEGAVVEIWQCDAEGHYHHPGDGGRADPAFQGFGRVTVGADGRYRFRTLRPAPYSGRTPHIHFKVRHDGRELLTTQLYVQADPGNARDGLWRQLRDPRDRAALTVAFEPAVDGLRARFPIVVAV
jgi:protocatechuate 3,4-dioxygenase beta subunit